MAASNYRPIGMTGLNTSGGRIIEEFLTELRGDKWRRVVREMSEQDDMIGAILFAIEMMLRQVEWRVEPYDEDGESVNRAEFVDDCLYDMADTFDDTLAEILSMLPWGFAPLEVTFKRRQDGRVGWQSWSIRGQDTVDEWAWDSNNNLTGFWQMAPPKYQRVFLPVEKLLLFRTTSRKGNPEGRSILRNAYRSWYFKKHIQNIEGVGIERDLAGLPVAWIPPQYLADDAPADMVAIRNAVKDVVTNIKRDEQEGVIWPLAYDDHGNKLFDLQLLSTGGTRQFDTDKIIQRYDQRIAMTVLADFILLGHEKVGSFSLSSDKTNMFSTALAAWLDSIAETINRFAIPKLFKLNGWPADQLPRLVHGDIEKISLTELADFVSKLSGSIIQPDDELERYLRQQADLPEPAEPRQQPQPVVVQAPPQDETDDDDAQMAAYIARKRKEYRELSLT